MKRMRITINPRADGRASAAFTLPEVLVAASIFSFLVIGIVSANLFGLKWYQIGQTKLLATDTARAAMGRMTDELRNCNSNIVGNVTTNGIFTAHVEGEAQTGNGLLIFPTTNTNNYTAYFLNKGDNTFRRYTYPGGTTNIIARMVTNAVIFRVQDFRGNVLTNTQNNRLIRCSLEFYSTQPKNPVSDYYKLETMVAPRALN